MTRERIEKEAAGLVERAGENIIRPEFAIAEDVAGMRMYAPPMVGFGDAKDPIFEKLRDPRVVGPHLRLPEEWLPGARTVISVFLPKSAEVRADNARDMALPSPGWLHARFEGQKLLEVLAGHLVGVLQGAGHRAVAPMLSPEMQTNDGKPGRPAEIPVYSSNWSERHAAYICGLGTFGLSKGLITARGVAGRFTSVITDLPLSPDERPYTGVYEYCSQCGACVKNCPAGAIDLETGKDHPKCEAFLNRMQERYSPRYGCGKCQIRVPCETRPGTR